MLVSAANSAVTFSLPYSRRKSETTLEYKYDKRDACYKIFLTRYVFLSLLLSFDCNKIIPVTTPCGCLFLISSPLLSFLARLGRLARLTRTQGLGGLARIGGLARLGRLARAREFFGAQFGLLVL